MSPIGTTAATWNYTITNQTLFPPWNNPTIYTPIIMPTEETTVPSDSWPVSTYVPVIVVLFVISIISGCCRYALRRKRTRRRVTAVVAVRPAPAPAVPVAPPKPNTRLTVLSQRTIVLVPVPVPANPESGASTLTNSRRDTTSPKPNVNDAPPAYDEINVK